MSGVGVVSVFVGSVFVGIVFDGSVFVGSVVVGQFFVFNIVIDIVTNIVEDIRDLTVSPSFTHLVLCLGVGRMSGGAGGRVEEAQATLMGLVGVEGHDPTLSITRARASHPVEICHWLT